MHKVSLQCEMYIFGNKYYFIVTTLVTRVVELASQVDKSTLIPKASFKTCLSINYKLILKISCIYIYIYIRIFYKIL